MSALPLDEIDYTVRDWRPSAVASREAIRLAIIATAAEHGGRVHIIGIRQHLPAWVNPQQIGAVVCKLVRDGYLVPTGRTKRNGGTASRNRTKRAEVRRLVKPIPAEVIA